MVFGRVGFSFFSDHTRNTQNQKPEPLNWEPDTSGCWCQHQRRGGQGLQGLGLQNLGLRSTWSEQIIEVTQGIVKGIGGEG